MGMSADGPLWDEWVRLPRADAVGQSVEKAGDGSQGRSVLFDPACGTGGFLQAAIDALRVGRGRDHLNRLQGATYRAHSVFDALDEQEAEDSPLVLQLEPQDNCWPVRAADFIWNDLLIQCKSCHDHLDITTPDLPEYDAPAPQVVAPDALGACWQTLPRYTDRPFVPCSRCGESALTKETVAAARSPKVPVPATMSRRELYELAIFVMCDPVYRQLCKIVAPLTVTIRDKRLAQDYRQGLRCFVDAVLDVLRRMVVMVLAALSHLAQAPPFLLVILGAIRHYGRRGESDGHSLLTLRVQPMTPRGAACLAA